MQEQALRRWRGSGAKRPIRQIKADCFLLLYLEVTDLPQDIGDQPSHPVGRHLNEHKTALSAV